MHACPPSKGKARVLVHDPSSSPGELPWLVACHKFSLGLVAMMMGGRGSAKYQSAPAYLVISTLGLISGCSGGCSAAHTEHSTWGIN